MRNTVPELGLVAAVHMQGVRIGVLALQVDAGVVEERNGAAAAVDESELLFLHLLEEVSARHDRLKRLC